jgi:hypothetical protein
LELEIVDWHLGVEANSQQCKLIFPLSWRDEQEKREARERKEEPRMCRFVCWLLLYVAMHKHIQIATSFFSRIQHPQRKDKRIKSEGPDLRTKHAYSYRNAFTCLAKAKGGCGQIESDGWRGDLRLEVTSSSNPSRRERARRSF